MSNDAVVRVLRKRSNQMGTLALIFFLGLSLGTCVGFVALAIVRTD